MEKERKDALEVAQEEAQETQESAETQGRKALNVFYSWHVSHCLAFGIYANVVNAMAIIAKKPSHNHYFVSFSSIG